MVVECAAGELTAALNNLSSCIDRKTTIPILSSVLMEDMADGKLRLTATDLNVGLILTIPCNVQLVPNTGRACVELSRLQAVVKTLPKGDIVRMVVTENHWITFSCGGLKARIPGFDPQSFPEIPAPKISKAKINAARLAALVRKTSFSISQEESRFTLNGALVEVADGMVKMVSTDGHRMSVARCEAEGELRVILSLAGLRLIEKVFEGESEQELDIFRDDGIMICGSCQVYIREVMGNFPDYKRVMPAGYPSEVEISSTSILPTLSRVMVFADDRSKAIRVQVKDNKLSVSANTSELGEAVDSVNCQYDGAEFLVGLNGSYVVDICKQAAALRWSFKDSNSAVKFSAIDGSADWVVMPMRV